MEEINLSIKTEGYRKIDNNIFNLDNKILNEFELIYNEKKYSNNGHENTSIINNINDLKNFPYVNKLFRKILDLVKYNKISNIEFEDIWFVKSVESIYEPKKLPYVPHIDKVRKFKAMIYLNNVTLDDGPLYMTKINPNLYEDFRKNLKPDYKIKQENVVKNINLSSYKPLIGKLGTTIFFDTNTPHFAGKLSSEKSLRKIIRINFKFKKKSLLERLKKKLF